MSSNPNTTAPSSNENNLSNATVSITTSEVSQNLFFEMEDLFDALRQFPIALLKTVTEIAGKFSYYYCYRVTIDDE